MKIRNVLSTIILILVLTLTVGFSAFVSEMSISNLVANVRVEKNVRITDVKLLSEQCNSTSVSSLDYDVDSVLMSALFTDDTSYAVIEVTITNVGNVDVGLADISLSETYYEYEILSGELGQAISSLGGTSTYIIKVGTTTQPLTTDMDVKVDFDLKEKYYITYTNMTNNNYPSSVIESDSLNVTFTGDIPDSVNVYSNGVLLDSSKYTYENGTLNIYTITGNIEIRAVFFNKFSLVLGDEYTPGSMVCLAEECFRIIENNGSTLKLLSRYNLYVGYSVDADWDVSDLEEPTGLQDKTALGYKSDISAPYIGTIEFSSEWYWGERFGLSDYPADVYDKNSSLYSHIENYKSSLLSYGANVLTARPIYYSELLELGCTEDATNYIYSCESAPSWVYETSYWTGTARYGNEVVSVEDTSFSGSWFDAESRYGIRPLIEINSEDIALDNVISFTISYLGDSYEFHAEEGMIWEEWIYSEYNFIDFIIYNEYITDEMTQMYIFDDYAVTVSDEIVDGGSYNFRIAI